MAEGPPKKRGDSTMDVLLSELDESPPAEETDERGDPSLQRILGELDAQPLPTRPKSIPPPLKPRSERPGPRAAPPGALAVSKAPPPAPPPTAGPPRAARPAPAAPPPGLPPAPAAPPTAAPRAVPPAPAPKAATSPGAVKAPTTPRAATSPGATPSPAADPEKAHLVEPWERELAATKSPPRRARLHAEIGRIAEMHLKDGRLAAIHYQEALALLPDHLPAVRGARRLHLAKKSWAQALPLFDTEIRLTKDGRSKAALLLSKGRVLEDGLGQKPEARAAYRAAHDLDKNDVSILKALEQLDADVGKPEDVSRDLERAANALASDARHRAALIVQRARLGELSKKDDATATELYEAALALDPSSRSALDALKRLHHQKKRWRDLIRVLGHEGEQADDAMVRAMAHYRVAKISGERLGQRDEAVRALERARVEAAGEPAVLAALSRLYEEEGRFSELAQVLAERARLLEASAAPGAGVQERVVLLSRLGSIRAERLNDTAGAIEAWQAALALSPLHLPTLQALSEAYERAGRWDALVRMLAVEASQAAEPKRRATAHARIAEISEAQLNKVDAAIEHHARALTIAPGWPSSFRALVRLYTERGRFRELAELYGRAIDELEASPKGEHGAGSGDEAVVTLLMKLGAVQEDSLCDPTIAAHTYRRVLTKDAKHLPAIHALQRTTERAGRWAEHVEALELEARLTKDKGQILALLTRAGEVLESALGDGAQAIDRLRKALELDPKYVPALARLGRSYRSAGRWEELLDVYRREAELAETKELAAVLHLEMGEIAEKRLGQEDEAIVHFRRAVELDVANREALAALSRALHGAERWKDLASVLEIELAGAPDKAARARLATQAAEIYEERLGQVERAISLYELARDAEPSFRPALDALVRLRTEQAAYKKLADELEREASVVEDASTKMAALARAAEVWGEHLGEPRRAAAAWERVLELEPGHVQALLALEGLHRRLGNHESLAKTLATLARTLADPGARIASLRALARIFETRLPGKGGEAKGAYLAILSLAPDDPGALAALERIALEGSEADLLTRIDERLIEGSDDPTVKAAYEVRHAEALEASDPTAAIEAFGRALAADPESLAATRGLSRCAERAGDQRALAEALRREAAILEDKPQASRLLVRSGELSLMLADPAQAALDYERALELDPDAGEPAAELLELLLASDQAGRAVDRLAAAAAATKSEARALELWMEVARLQADAQNNVPAAIASLSKVAKASAAHVPTLRRLAALYQRAEAWTEAGQTLSKVVQLAPDRDVLKDAHLELSGIYEKTDDRARQRVSLQAVLSLEPQNRVALGRLASLEKREGHVEKAIEVQRRRVEAAQEGDDRADALALLAELEDQRGQTARAIDALAEAVVVQGPTSPAGSKLGRKLRTLEEEGRPEAGPGWAKYAQALAEHVRRAPALVEPRLALAAVLGDQLGKAAEAAQVLRDAVKAFPDEVELRRHLARRLTRAGQTPEAIDVLRRLADERPDRPEGFRDLRLLLGPAAELSVLAAAPLVLIGPDPAEQEAHRARRPHPAAGRPGSFGLDLVAPLAGIDPGAPVLAALACLPEAMTRMWPPNLDEYGITSRERMTTRGGHPLRLLSDRVAAMFGVGEHELYVHRLRGRGVAIELSEPATIILPPAVLEMSEAAQVFALARAHAHVATRTAIVEKLTPRELEVFLAAAMRPSAPGFGAGLTSEDVLEDQQKKIQKSLSRRPRNTLTEIAPRYVAAPPPDFGVLVRGIQYGVARAALVVCDDLVSAIELLHRSEREHAEPIPALLKSAPLVQDLVRFWTSDVAQAVRRRLAAVA